MTEILKSDYFWNFEGWNKVPSRVHIRIIHESNKPMVVVCSQPLYGAGTSVQNAYNILKDHLAPIFEMRLGYKPNKNPKEELLGLIDEIRQSKMVATGIALWVLGKLSKRLSRDTYHKYKLSPDLNVIWLEHWPPGTDPIMGPPDDYILVRENNIGQPLHLRVEAKYFLELVGYDPKLIMKSSEIFKNDTFKEKI